MARSLRVHESPPIASFTDRLEAVALRVISHTPYALPDLAPRSIVLRELSLVLGRIDRQRTLHTVIADELDEFARFFRRELESAELGQHRYLTTHAERDALRYRIHSIHRELARVMQWHQD